MVKNEDKEIKDKLVKKTIVNDVSGICKSREVTAILGASGAGKTYIYLKYSSKY